MTPTDLKKYFGSCYNFNKKTGMSAMSFQNWSKWGFVPVRSQYKIQTLTNGKLIAEWHDCVNDEWRKSKQG